MISNYHTASSGPEGDYFYTFGGMEDTVPVSKKKGSKNKRQGNGLGGRLFNRKVRNTPQPPPVVKSGDTIVSDASQGGQSLAYSTGSSWQSAGESTASTEFSRMINVLDAEDKRRKVDRNGSGRSLTNQSVASSLNYSDSETSSHQPRSHMKRGNSANSLDYSTDASESLLEGTRLLQMLTEDSAQNKSVDLKNEELLGGNFESEEEENPFDMKFEAAQAPKKKRSSPQRVDPPPAEPEEPKSSEVSVRSSCQFSEQEPNSILDSPQQSAKKVKTLQQYRGGSGKRKPQSQSSNNHPKNQWACGLDAIGDSIPPNVKTFLRPFLCGVI